MDFLILLIGIAAVLIVIVIVAVQAKQWKIRRLTNPRKDYYKRSASGKPKRKIPNKMTL